ncbi:MAG: nicotinate (nicotinamide) nucleotide adenylyltransferase [Vallitaleaceae bacterium]|nr:nicotinate (nicotinamide) nucleotide adenylyltransferase [Vallitaleaceae bacterium]
MIRTAILGGTFNPIHNGHIIIIQELLSQSIVDEVWLMPSGYPPFKPEERKSASYRYEMCCLAVSGIEHVYVSDYEINSKAPSYTYDTLSKLSELYKNREFYWVIGFDHLSSLMTWYQASSLLEKFQFILMNRGGYDFHQAAEYLRQIESQYPKVFLKVTMPTIEISSTSIRNRVYHRQSLIGYTKDSVIDYINHHQLYREAQNGSAHS